MDRHVERLRQLLENNGFSFCDSAKSACVDRQWCAQQQAVEAQFHCEEQLIDAAVTSSTCDSEEQTIEMTLVDQPPREPARFWSSTGSDEKDVDEWLLYHLRSPVSRVEIVKLKAYRAFYQHGDPLYPPQEVSFEIGPTPMTLESVPGRYQFRAVDGPQYFSLPGCSPVGHYLRIRLHGRQQRQLQDNKWYVAIELVGASGKKVRASDILELRTLMLMPSMNYTGSTRECMPSGKPCLPGNILDRLAAEKLSIAASSEVEEEDLEAQKVKKSELAAAFASLRKVTALEELIPDSSKYASPCSQVNSSSADGLGFRKAPVAAEAPVEALKSESSDFTLTQAAKSSNPLFKLEEFSAWHEDL
eukprot:jgi/Botrbrau1/20241/Bobra.31_1s0034.1